MSEPQPVIPYITPPPPVAKKRFGRGLIGWLLFVGFSVVLIVFLQTSRRDSVQITISDFYDALENGEISNVWISETSLDGTSKVPWNNAKTGAPTKQFHVQLPAGMNGNWSFVQWMIEHRNGADIQVDNGGNLWLNLIVPFVPWLLIFGFIWFFVIRVLRKAQQPQQPRPIPVYLVPEQREDKYVSP